MPFRLIVRTCFIALGVLCVAGSAGCYQRTVAPELTYDQSQIDLLNGEIKKLEWD